MTETSTGSMRITRCFADGRKVAGNIQIRHAVIAGWTGRSIAAVEAHIHELELLGVARPRSVPVYYRVASNQLTTASELQFLGTGSTGEVEVVVYRLEDGFWVGVGSDHTDRDVEAKLNVAASKQICSKPVSSELWKLEEIAEHWDELRLRSYATVASGRRLYQSGTVAAMRRPLDLIAEYEARGTAFPVGGCMFCGTFTVEGGHEPATDFEIEMEDPVTNRKIVHRYAIQVLPVEQ